MGPITFAALLPAKAPEQRKLIDTLWVSHAANISVYLDLPSLEVGEAAKSRLRAAGETESTQGVLDRGGDWQIKNEVRAALKRGYTFDEIAQALKEDVSVHFFHGDKRGVGKSFVAQSFVDWLVTRGIAPLVIDSDMRNPDLACMFPDAAVPVDLRQHEGWLELLSLLHESDREQVVVSLAAGIGAEIAPSCRRSSTACASWDARRLSSGSSHAPPTRSTYCAPRRRLSTATRARWWRSRTSSSATRRSSTVGTSRGLAAPSKMPAESSSNSPSCSIGSSIRRRRPTRQWRSRKSSTVCVLATAPS